MKHRCRLCGWCLTCDSWYPWSICVVGTKAGVTQEDFSMQGLGDSASHRCQQRLDVSWNGRDTQKQSADDEVDSQLTSRDWTATRDAQIYNFAQLPTA